MLEQDGMTKWALDTKRPIQVLGPVVLAQALLRMTSGEADWWGSPGGCRGGASGRPLPSARRWIFWVETPRSGGGSRGAALTRSRVLSRRHRLA